MLLKDNFFRFINEGSLHGELLIRQYRKPQGPPVILLVSTTNDMNKDKGLYQGAGHNLAGGGMV